ncbi:CheR family methyltransferase [Oceanobacillus manasiensis]|uniref:CheR family methyltransferase n=1 Tax=Oceanobacillus manasiensis TaxID=586413 RepID=UPI000A064F57|nr:protein-glutamate O-methyltransferase CheR [Oceanobacillus manasiensis]
MIDEYVGFTANIKSKLGIDLNLYKEAQMKRRLTSLRNKRGFSNFKSYFEAMNQEEVLLNEFIDRITINVSEYYRNPKRWVVLEKEIFPALLKKTKKLSIWSAACSTGEEPYSLAILLNEHFPQLDFQITATDIDLNALEKAKQGVYSEQSLKELPNKLKEKFFREQHGLYSVKPVLREKILFKQHNLLADSYPKNMDLIVCRNVLIYFTDPAKETIYHNFSASLKKGGFLFVGSTEQIFNPTSYDMNLKDTFFYEKL